MPGLHKKRKIRIGQCQYKFDESTLERTLVGCCVAPFLMSSVLDYFLNIKMHPYTAFGCDCVLVLIIEPQSKVVSHSRFVRFQHDAEFVRHAILHCHRSGDCVVRSVRCGVVSNRLTFMCPLSVLSNDGRWCGLPMFSIQRFKRWVGNDVAGGI